MNQNQSEFLTRGTEQEPASAWRRRLPERLRIARLAAGLKQSVVATMLGRKGNSALAQFEAGTQTPSLDDLDVLARVLEVSVPWLLFGIDTGKITVVAKGVGGPDIPISDPALGDALIAVYPRAWAPSGDDVPHGNSILLVSAEWTTGSRCVVRRTKAGLIVTREELEATYLAEMRKVARKAPIVGIVRAALER